MQSDAERRSRITSFRLSELSRYCQGFVHPTSGSDATRRLHDVFAGVLRVLRHLLAFDHLALALHNQDRNVGEIILQAGETDRPVLEIPIQTNSLGLVVHENQAIEVNDVEHEDRFPDLVSLAKSEGFGSFRVVPLRTDRHTLGGMGVLRKQASAFSEEDAAYIDNAAQLLALLLENAFMAEVLGCEKTRLETLREVNSALISSLDVQELFANFSKLITRVIHQDFSVLALAEPDRATMKLYVLDGQSNPIAPTPTLRAASDCPSGIAYQRGEVVQFKEADLRAIGTSCSQALLDQGVRSASCFPLTSRGRRLGALALEHTREIQLSEDDVVLLNQIAADVAIAIDNARSHEEIAKLKDTLSKEKLYLEEEIRSQHNFGEVVGNSPALCHVLKQVEIAAPSDATVLVQGETGTGKELIARALHRLSSRREANFIKLNCAAIPTGLLESELFGHEKGAFTGAISQKVGRLELADKGTLFLDEIGEIPTEIQPKLLRVLQDHEFERLGGIRTIRVNVRLIAATNRDLAEAVESHQFRRDLYYRLNVFPIRVPPLRERSGDIPLLAQYFVQKFARRMGKTIECIPIGMLRELAQWHWPGNIRELENFIERSVILTQGPVLYAPMAELRSSSADRGKAFGTTLEDVERDYILRTLRESGGVISGVRGAAARLGLKRTTLQSRMQKLGITRGEYQA